MTCLIPPVLECFGTDQPFLDILAVRSGPDRLDVHAFDSAPVQVTAVAYWYHEHLWCEEPTCRCVHDPRRGDGFCIVGYQDGSFGWLQFLPHAEGVHAIDWSQPTARIDQEQLKAIRRAGSQDAELADAYAAVWLAFDDAIARGMFEQSEARKRIDTKSARRWSALSQLARNSG